MNQNNKVLYEKKTKKKCEKTRYTCMHIARHSSTKELFLFFCGEVKKKCGYENGSRNQEIKRS